LHVGPGAGFGDDDKCVISITPRRHLHLSCAMSCVAGECRRYDVAADKFQSSLRIFSRAFSRRAETKFPSPCISEHETRDA
uniref:hypothetical protein n=1 Tax=Salmonella sp. M206 TaxID=3240295 RepID=UPI00352ADC57